MSRLPWTELPPAVREWAAELLGSEIVQWQSQQGGFSPGSADIVTTAAGRRAFIKAVGFERNPESPDIHRKEARIAATFDPQLPVPHLLGVYDDGDWVALAFEPVEGAPPALPWQRRDVVATLDACEAIARWPVPPGIPHVLDFWRSAADDWLRVQSDLDAATIAELHRLAVEAGAHIGGDHLVQLDLRADNVLITRSGRAVIVDWPWAHRGPSWFDALTLLFNVRLYDSSHDVEEYIRGHSVFETMPDDAADAVLALLAGFFLARSQEPPSPGVERVRGFQREQAEAILGWLADRFTSR